MKTLNQLYLVKIDNISDPFLSKVEQTYMEAFPPNERRDFELAKGLIVSETAFNLYIFIREGEYVGFITTWSFESFLYVEHFAIDASQRSGGIGSKALELLDRKSVV